MLTPAIKEYFTLAFASLGTKLTISTPRKRKQIIAKEVKVAKGEVAEGEEPKKKKLIRKKKRKEEKRYNKNIRVSRVGKTT